MTEQDGMLDQLYARQHVLNVTPPEQVVIVGCGGVGTWAALFLALAGTPKIVLIDSDVVRSITSTAPSSVPTMSG
jgi:tRNA A37 threonylcarbamoyladenosine dehydratase